jgi:hypothetical protein
MGAGPPAIGQLYPCHSHREIADPTIPTVVDGCGR